MTAVTFAIRRATPEDADGIARVHVAAIRGLAKDSYTPDLVATSDAGDVLGFSGYCGNELRAVYVHRTSRAAASARGCSSRSKRTHEPRVFRSWSSKPR